MSTATPLPAVDTFDEFVDSLHLGDDVSCELMALAYLVIAEMSAKQAERISDRRVLEFVQHIESLAAGRTLVSVPWIIAEADVFLRRPTPA
ncbi:hypothetical protein [Limnoglobus roseus]|uniref:Uncharacterized protein n=1 Tax=Limnoglobus roseus TaxID=2598579 RepID=A0A5C1AGF7_9BACT|nr:hypothetical protein [Limnoglobus roseus]QEL18291.1 hypothetical protein PX52LOC_05310 [Limnoglobus roseus]